VIGISPEALDALGEIFVNLKLQEKYGIPFYRFVELKVSGEWEVYASC